MEGNESILAHWKNFFHFRKGRRIAKVWKKDDRK